MSGGTIRGSLGLYASLLWAETAATWPMVNGSFNARSTCSACKHKIIRKIKMITTVSSLGLSINNC